VTCPSQQTQTVFIYAAIAVWNSLEDLPPSATTVTGIKGVLDLLRKL